MTVGVRKEPGKFILFFSNFPYQTSAYKQGLKILYPDHPAAQPSPTLQPCHSLLIPNSDQRVQWWRNNVFRSVPMYHLYWIHIYVTDWSYDAGLQRERSMRFKTHAYKWQHHCKKAQGAQMEGAEDRLREHYMLLSLHDSSSLLNPERAPHGLETCRELQYISSCDYVAVIKLLLLARRQLSTDLPIRHALSCWAHWESWCRSVTRSKMGPTSW